MRSVEAYSWLDVCDILNNLIAKDWIDDMNVLDDCICCDLADHSDWIDKSRLSQPAQLLMYMRHYVGWFGVCLNQEGELAGHDAFGIAWVDTVHLAERGGSHGQ